MIRFRKFNVPSVISSDWDLIFKNPTNKLQFKKLFIKRIEDKLRHELDLGDSLYLNVCYPEGLTKVVVMSQVYELEDKKIVPGESDFKIFQFIEHMIKRFYTSFLILSMDTDVKG